MCWWDLHTLTPVVGPTAPHPTPHHSGFTHPNGSQHRHCACRIHGSHLGKATIFAPSEEFLRPPNHPLSLFAPLRGQIRGLRTLSQLGVRAWWDHCLGSACTPDYQGSAGLVCFQLWPQGGVQAIQTLAPSSCLLVTSPCTDKYS